MAGYRHPRLMIGVFLTVSVASWTAVGWGAFEMNRIAGETGATAATIGIGFPIGVIATGMLFLAIRSARAYRRFRRGENAIGRWIVAPEDFAAFAANNAARNALGPAYHNEWRPPRAIPAAGLTIVFNPEGVLVGDTYFSLVTTGQFKFEGVQMLPGEPLAIEFGTVETTVSSGTTFHVHRNRGVLRLPVPRLARDDAVKVFDHFKRVDAREIIINPDFYRRRIGWGLRAAPVCFLIAATGFGLQAAGYGNLLDGALCVGLAVAGAVSGLGALALALIAWMFSQAQHAKRR
jgi:hypothetical protein